MLYGKMVLSPYAQATIKSIDTSAAEKMPGVKAVQVMREPGVGILWAGQEVVAVAAETEEQARDAARRVVVNCEKLPHLVRDVEPAKAGDRDKPGDEQGEGGPDKGLYSTAGT